MRIYNKKKTNCYHYSNHYKLGIEAHKKNKPIKSQLSILNPKVNLSSSIEHSTRFYNKIISTHSHNFTNGNRQNISTEISKSTYPNLPQKIISHSKKAFYKTEVSQDSNRSRNNNQNSFLLSNYRVESLSQFNDKIRQERMNRIYNTIANDLLIQKNSINENSIVSIKVNNSSHLTTNYLLNSFMVNYRQYCTQISNDIKKENDTNNKLKLHLTTLQTEIDKLRLRKAKYLQSFEHNFQIKKFLLCVKNKTLNCDKFSENDAIEHREDIKKQNCIKSEYTFLIKAAKRIKTLQRKTTFHKTPYFKNGSIKEHLDLNLYQPKVNKEVFKDVDEFNRVFDDLTEHLSALLVEDNNKKMELDALRKEALSFQTDYMKEKELIQQMSVKVELKEKELEQIKKKNINLTQFKEKLPNIFDDSLPNAKKKVCSIFRVIKNSSIKCEVLNRNSYTSQSLIYLEAIEISFNYLISKNREFKANYRSNYNAFKSQMDKVNKIKQALITRNNEEQRTLRKKIKIMKNTSKVYFIPKRKVNKNHYSLEANARNNSSCEDKDQKYQEFIDQINEL